MTNARLLITDLDYAATDAQSIANSPNSQNVNAFVTMVGIYPKALALLYSALGAPAPNS